MPKKIVRKKSSSQKPEKTSKSSKPDSIANFGSKLNNLYFHPNNFLKSIEKENKFEALLKTFVLFYLFYAVVILIIQTVLKTANFYLIIANFVYSIIFAVVVVFAFSGIIHIGVLIFKGREKYFNTYKPVIYMIILGIIYSFIILICSLIFPFTPIQADLMQQALNTAGVKQIWLAFISQPGAIINTILQLITLIHLVAFAVMGISKFQKISKLKAFGAVVLPFIVIIALWIMFILLYLAANS